VPYLTRGRACSSKLLLGLASTDTLGSESRRTDDHTLLPQVWDTLQYSPPPNNRVAQSYPKALGFKDPVLSSCTLAHGITCFTVPKVTSWDWREPAYTAYGPGLKPGETFQMQRSYSVIHDAPLNVGRWTDCSTVFIYLAVLLGLPKGKRWAVWRGERGKEIGRA
jgi:hypothetical protein